MSDNHNKSGDASLGLPCTSIDDLYAVQAQRTLKRLLEAWLAAERLSVIEFMHSAAALRKFENAGTSYQHAVQRMAVTIASRTKQPVVQIVRALTALTTAAMSKVYADEREGLFPALDTAGLFAHGEALMNDSAGLYAVNGILAKFLSGAASWDAKMGQLLTLYEEAQERMPDSLVSRASQAMIADIVSDPAMLSEFLCPKRDFAQRILGAVRILNGRAATMEEMAVSLKRLAAHIAQGEFRDARLAIADYVRTECASTKRLAPTSFVDELALFRTLIEELEAVPSAYLHAGDIELSLTERSKRFVTPEALAELTAGCETPDAVLERVLDFEPAITGVANKRALSVYALSRIHARNFETELPAEYRGIPRLRRIAELQHRVLRSELAEAQRQEMAAALDMAASRLETEGRYLAGMETRIADPAERVEFYLRLFDAGVFTQGALARKARRAILAALAQPGCAASYAERKGTSRQAALMQLVEQLKAVGITPEESLGAMSPG